MFYILLCCYLWIYGTLNKISISISTGRCRPTKYIWPHNWFHLEKIRNFWQW